MIIPSHNDEVDEGDGDVDGHRNDIEVDGFFNLNRMALCQIYTQVDVYQVIMCCMLCDYVLFIM